jgi:hypothetical protein
MPLSCHLALCQFLPGHPYRRSQHIIRRTRAVMRSSSVIYEEVISSGPSSRFLFGSGPGMTSCGQSAAKRAAKITPSCATVWSATGTLITPQSETDSNLNADSAPNRVFVNPNGNPSVGSATQALTNSAGQTVAYLAVNPNAGYVAAPKGTLHTGGRNLINLNPIDDFDLTLAKKIDINERFKMQLAIRVFNVLNHPQYTGGYLDDALFTQYTPNSVAGQVARTSFDPKSPAFEQWDQVFSSNPRSVIISLKLIF